MNHKVREYLIEVAREGNKAVSYLKLIKANDLKINPDLKSGQNQLRQLLNGISAYENQSGRPMLTALVRSKLGKDHGSGFYEIAEQLGFGDQKTLRESRWGDLEVDRVRDFWQDDRNYEQFAKTERPKHQANKVSRLFESLTFSEEYQWAKEDWWDYYIDFVVDVKKLQAALAKNPQMNIDNPKLYKTLSRSIQSYETFMSKWLKENRNGISSRGQSVLSGDDFRTIINDPAFKVLSRVVINDPTPKTYQLLTDWWYSNKEISNRPLLINRAVAACLPEKLSSTVDGKKFWYVVETLKAKYDFKLDSTVDWNWFTANEELTSWLDSQLRGVIEKFSDDILEQQIWRNIFVWLIYDKHHGKQSIPVNTLIRCEPPEDGYDEIPLSNDSFEGREVDFEKKAKIQKDLGDSGEELVKLHEIEELKNRKLFKQAKLVRIAKPGEGFDVYSFDERGHEKFIEVKTTIANWKNPFYLTRQEIKFMQKNKSNYSLYRVYNFDAENNSGEFFELRGDIEKRIIKEPTQFEVVIKKK